MTTQEKIAVMQAHLDGKPIACRSTNETAWHPCPYPLWNWDQFDYCIASPKQLGPDDFPPGTVVRNKNWMAYCWKAVVAVSTHDLTMINSMQDNNLMSIRFDNLTSAWERSPDGGKTWLPCT